jgi:hypothetical protein
VNYLNHTIGSFEVARLSNLRVRHYLRNLLINSIRWINKHLPHLCIDDVLVHVVTLFWLALFRERKLSLVLFIHLK